MKRFVEHKYNGFWILPTEDNFQDHKDQWTLSIETDNYKISEDFNNNEDPIFFKTLKDAKKYVDFEGKQILNKYMEV